LADSHGPALTTSEPGNHSQGLTNWVCDWGENIKQKLGQIAPFETLEMTNFSRAVTLGK
jgi:hypothetical protein